MSGAPPLAFADLTLAGPARPGARLRGVPTRLSRQNIAADDDRAVFRLP